jgi:hypothetical protein
MPSDTPVPRYGGYIHSNPNCEDFEMWICVCEDAGPDWASRNAERAEREERERTARQAARREEERREVIRREQRERERLERESEIREREVARKEKVERAEKAEREQLERAKLEKEQREKEAIRKEQEREAKQALARKEATRRGQEKKEREQEEKRERKREADLALAREAVKKEIQRKLDVAKAEEAEQQLQELQMEANDEYCQRWIETVESGLPSTSTSEEQEPAKDLSADLTQRLLNILRRRNAERTGFEDDKTQTERGESVDPDLAIELNHLRDILRAIAECLRAEQAERRVMKKWREQSPEDTTKDQPPAASWYAGCISMRERLAIISVSSVWSSGGAVESS